MAGRNDLTFEIGANVDDALRAVRLLNDQFTGNAKTTKAEIDRLLGAPIRQQIQIEQKVNLNGTREWVASLKEVGSNYDKIENKIDATNKLQDGSVTRLRQQVNEAKQARDQIAQFATQLYRADDGVLKITQNTKKLDDDWLKANEKVKYLTRELQIAGSSNFWDRVKGDLGFTGLEKAGRFVNDLVNTFQSVSIVVGQVTAIVNQFISTLGKIQQYEKTFQAIGLGAVSSGQAFSEANRIALEYGVGIDTVREGFVKLAPTVLQTGGSLDDVSGILEALSSRFVAFGLGADQSNRVMNAVVQAFGKGKLMAEELTQQISEADPAFRVDFANALGVSVTKLNELVAAGKITNDVMRVVIPKMEEAAVSIKQFGGDASLAVDSLARFGEGANATTRQIVALIDNTNQLSFERIVKSADELIAGVLDIGASFSALFKTISESQSIEFLSGVLGRLFSLVADGVGVLNFLVGVVVKVSDGIFGFINVIDEFGKRLIGIEPIASAVAVVLGIGLLGAVSNLIGVFDNASKLRLFITALGDMFEVAKTGATNAFKPLGDAVSAVSNAVSNTLTKAIDSSVTSLTGFTARTKETYGSLDDLDGYLIKAGTSSEVASVSFDRVYGSVDQLKKPLGQASVDFDAVSGSSSRMADNLDLTVTNMDTVAGSSIKVSDSARTLGGDFSSLDTSVLGVSGSFNNAAGDIDYANKSLGYSGTVVSSAGSSLGILNASLDTSGQKFRDLGEDAGYYAGSATTSTNVSRELDGVLRSTSGQIDGTTTSFRGATQISDDFSVSVADIGTSAEDSGKKISGLTGVIADLAASTAIMAAISLAFGVYNEATKYSDDINRSLKGSLEATTKALKDQGLATNEAEAGQMAFEAKLKQVQTEMRNQSKEAQGLGGFFLGLGQNILNTLNIAKIWNETLEIGKIMGARDAVSSLSKSYAAIQETGRQAEEAIRKFAEAGKNASDVLENSTTQAVVKQIVSYQEFIKKAIETRDKLLADAAVATNVATKAALTQAAADIDKQIQEAKQKLFEFKEYAQKNGIQVGIDIDGNALANTTAGFKAWIKELEEQQAVIKVGTQGFTEAQEKINGVKALMEALTQTPFEIKIAIAEVDLTVLKEKVSLYQAMTNEVKARGDAEVAVMGLMQASAEYQLTLIQERNDAESAASQERIANAESILEKTREVNNAEVDGIEARKQANKTASDEKLAQMQASLEKLREEGASQNQINAKEKEIADFKKRTQSEEKALDKEISDAKLRAKEEEKAAQQQIKDLKDAEAAAERQRQADEKAYQEYLKGIEAEIAVNKLIALKEQQAAEKASFDIKQQQEAAEREIIKMKNEQKVAELEIGKITAINTANELEGKARVLAATKGVMDAGVRALQQQAQGFRDLANSADGVISKQQQINAKYNEGDVAFRLRQEAERKAFAYNQQAQLANAEAALAQYGLIGDAVGRVTVKNGEWYKQVGTTVDAAGKVIPVYEHIQKFDPSAPWDRARQKLSEFRGEASATEQQVAGFITVGDKTVTVYKTVGTTFDQAGDRGKSAADRVGKGFESTAGTVSTIAPKIDSITTKTQATGNAAGTAAGDFGKIGKEADIASGKVDALSGKVGGVKSAAYEAARGMGAFTTAAGLAATAIDPLIKKTDEFKNKINDSKNAINLVNTGVVELTGKIATAKDETNEFAGKFVLTTDKVDLLTKAIANVKVKEKLTTPLEDARRAIEDINRAKFDVPFKNSANDAKIVADKMSDASGSIGGIVKSTIVKTASDFAGYASDVSSSFSTAKSKMDGIVSAIKGLDGFTATVTVQVVKVNSNFAGGPVKAGELTTINELGREAFLTKGGHLSMINKPKNSLWRPPTSGTVIPAHIAQTLDIPASGIKVNHSAASVVQGMARRDAGAPDVARALYAALESSGVISNSRYNATSQAAHAIQIGKLTHAINKLVDKNWDVNVNIKERNTGLGAHRTINRIV